MKKKQKEPITKGVAKTPLVMQMEATECGAACLTMILSHYGCYLPLEQIRYECGVSRDGANAFNVVKTARLHGMEAKGYRYKLETLREKAQYPCIIYWNYNHFIVLNGFRGGRAFLNDPAQGCYELPVEKRKAKEYPGFYTGKDKAGQKGYDHPCCHHRNSFPDRPVPAWLYPVLY